MMRVHTCKWCGQARKFQQRTPVTEYAYYATPMTSDRFPSLHLHDSCMYEMRNALWEEFPECIGIPSIEEVTNRVRLDR